MTKNTRFSPEVRQRAIRMVLESQGEYDSQWAAICSIAPKIGCTPETLRVWRKLWNARLLGRKNSAHASTLKLIHKLRQW